MLIHARWQRDSIMLIHASRSADGFSSISLMYATPLVGGAAPTVYCSSDSDNCTVVSDDFRTVWVALCGAKTGGVAPGIAPTFAATPRTSAASALIRVSSLFCLRFCSTGGRCLLASVRCAPVRSSRFRASRSPVRLTNRDARTGVRGGVLCLHATSHQPRRIPLPGDASGGPLFLWPGLGRAPGRLGVSSLL